MLLVFLIVVVEEMVVVDEAEVLLLLTMYVLLVMEVVFRDEKTWCAVDVPPVLIFHSCIKFCFFHMGF